MQHIGESVRKPWLCGQAGVATMSLTLCVLQTDPAKRSSNCAEDGASGRQRNRLCIRCLTEQHGYSPAELQQDLFTCPYCRGRASEARSGADAGESEQATRGDSLSRKRSRGHDDGPLVSSCPADAGALEQHQPHHSASKRPKTAQEDASGGPRSRSAAPQPPCTGPPPESVLLALRNFLEDAAGDRPGAQCRITVGALISALAKSSAKDGGSGGDEARQNSRRSSMCATAMSGLEYLRRTQEISIDVDVAAVEVSSVASLLRIGLLDLKLNRPNMIQGDRVMVKGPGNLWVPTQVMAVRGARSSRGQHTEGAMTNHQKVALLRYTGLGPAWDEWRPAHYSSKLAKLSSPEGGGGDGGKGSKGSCAQAASSCGDCWDDGDIDSSSSDVLFTSEEEEEDQEVDVWPESSVTSAAVRTSVKSDHGDSKAAEHHPSSTELGADASKGIPSAEATAAEGSAALAAAAAELPYQVGTLVEALDVAHKWFAARVVKLDLRKFGNQPRNKRMRIHFVGWGTEWDEWFDLNDPAQHEVCPHPKLRWQGGPQPYILIDYRVIGTSACARCRQRQRSGRTSILLGRLACGKPALPPRTSATVPPPTIDAPWMHTCVYMHTIRLRRIDQNISEMRSNCDRISPNA
eukprot:COSAG03_NODE_1646_length_3720_cov_9.610329_2_plen_634_part_00